MAADDAAAGDGSARDAKDLRRGVTVNLVGYAIKLAHPVLLAIATQLYGAERWGVFVVAQAAIMVLSRVCLFGLENGVLWWVARQEPPHERSGVLGSLLLTVTAAVLVALGIAILPVAWLADWAGDAGAVESMTYMAAALPPFVASEILLSATMAKRRMEPQVLVKETLVPITLLGTAALFFVLGFADTGLAYAFFASNVVGAAGAYIAFRRLFRGSKWPERPTALPRPLLKFAAPMWAGHIANSSLQRMDIVVVAAVTDPATVGVYAIVVQFANAVRAIRRSFDPIVTAIVSRLSAKPDPKRLADGYSYASVLVTATQVPVLVVLALAGPWLLALYGDGFSAGADALFVYCVFWGLLGPAGLAGVVVTAHGRSGLALFNVLVALGLTLGLVWVLAPPLGLVGAALGVGLAYAVQHALQVAQMRWITGSFNYTRAVVPAFGAAAVSIAACALAWTALSASGDVLARIGALVVFALCYGPAVLFLWRTGRLAAPRPSPAA